MTDLTPALIRRLADMHAVYRMYDHEGQLLYVGMTGRAGRRFDDHATKRWFPLVSTITLEWCATHAEAVLTEKRAIAAERPRYNIAGSPFAPKQPRARVKDEAVTPQEDALGDVLATFAENEHHLHWQVIAERLSAGFPSRWSGVTAKAISAHCRALGIRGFQCRMGPLVRAGCRRQDVADGVIHRRLSA